MGISVLIVNVLYKLRQIKGRGYERLLFNTLETYDCLWVKEATGLGIIEFIMRYIAWLYEKDDSSKGARMCIVSGRRLEPAVTLNNRMKQHFLGNSL